MARAWPVEGLGVFGGDGVRLGAKLDKRRVACGRKPSKHAGGHLGPETLRKKARAPWHDAFDGVLGEDSAGCRERALQDRRGDLRGFSEPGDKLVETGYGD